MDLNQEQKVAIATRHGVWVLVAVPGSGKTTVTTQRVQSLLRCTSSDKILVLTFTKEAAKEMELRSGMKRQPGQHRIFRTFHGYCLDFCTKYAREFPFELQHFPLLAPFEQFKIMSGVMRSLPRTPQKKLKYRDVMEFISRQKRGNFTPTETMQQATGEWGKIYAQAYGRYEASCRSLGKLDFDSLLVETVRLLESRPDIRKLAQPEQLMCDEAQDNDRIQWRLIQLLAAGNLMAVGDPDQNMYSWRGAEADGLTTKFAERFPGSRQLPLAENYRSTEEIIAFLNEIKPSSTVIMRCGRRTHGPKPAFIKYAIEDEEACKILDGLADPKETAILARTNRQLKFFEELCGERDIKYKLLGKSGFYHQSEVENVVAMAQYYINPTDAVIKRILTAPYDSMRMIRHKEVIDGLTSLQSRQVGRVSLNQLLPQYRSADSQQNQYIGDLIQKLRTVGQQIQGKTAENALRHIITSFNILNYYEDESDIDNNPSDNVRSLLRIAEKKATLLDFVNCCVKAKRASRSTAKRLVLSTIHQAKGKEWRAVYVVGVNLDILPHKNSELEEEKRIFFVACSRAEYRLEVSCSGAPSEFIKSRLPADPENEQVDYIQRMYQIANEVGQN